MFDHLKPFYNTSQNYLQSNSDGRSFYGDRAGDEEGVPVDECKEAEKSKELTLSQAAEEEEEEEEPDVYYFESDHLALKHNKEYVGAPQGFCSLLLFY